MNIKERTIANGRLKNFVTAVEAETKLMRSFLKEMRDREEYKLFSMPDSLQNSPTGQSIEEYMEMLDEKIDAIDEIESEIEASFGSF